MPHRDEIEVIRLKPCPHPECPRHLGPAREGCDPARPACAGVPVSSPSVARPPLSPSLSGLTPRQREIALLLAQDLANKAIGSLLGISEKRAQVHRSNILRLLRLHGIAALTLALYEAGWIDITGTPIEAVPRSGDECPPRGEDRSLSHPPAPYP